MIRRFGLATLILVVTAFSALAGGVKSYDAASFDKAIADGKSVIVHVHADWCPTCKRQQPTIKSLSADPDLSAVEFVEVNFDKHKDFLKANRVPSQSVILIFKGGKEVGRLNSVTDAEEITSKIKAAVG